MGCAAVGRSAKVLRAIATGTFGTAVTYRPVGESACRPTFLWPRRGSAWRSVWRAMEARTSPRRSNVPAPTRSDAAARGRVDRFRPCASPPVTAPGSSPIRTRHLTGRAGTGGTGGTGGARSSIAVPSMDQASRLLWPDATTDRATGVQEGAERDRTHAPGAEFPRPGVPASGCPGGGRSSVCVRRSAFVSLCSVGCGGRRRGRRGRGRRSGWSTSGGGRGAAGSACRGQNRRR
ncbi:hypothetical protein BZB76_4251 [Actinomadura pelletieri DSM 43383]|uniref:Uncharacterized protein n=1 Tax=Actinomadura pelletieri DSM 43383 TaxID=1120940 RepID=A0A495QLV7_9ACTN|nr:hypothetical protein BZB76_4251 [Actinomadura pelletieri DSM 43383]